MHVCIHVSMLLFDKVVRDHSYGGMISYAWEWHEEVPDLMRKQLGRVFMTNIQGQYHVDMNWHWIMYYSYVYVMIGNVEGYIRKVKEVWFVTCYGKHGYDMGIKVSW